MTDFFRAKVSYYGGKPIVGYVDRWYYENSGEVCPLFTTESMMKILEDFNSIPDGHTKMDYDPYTDTFEVCDFAAQEIYKMDAAVKDTDDGRIRLHDFWSYQGGYAIADSALTKARKNLFTRH